MPVPAALAAGTASPGPAPQPTIRLQAPDPPPARPARLVLASPEALGVSAPRLNETRTPELDWNSVSGGSRVTFVLPMAAQRIHEIEATADTEAAAVTAALEHAEAWAAARK
jgi:hypothetical protein